MATASDPEGPYADSASQPAVCDNDYDAPPTIDDGYDGGSIDPYIFMDPASGNYYLLWKSDGNHLQGDTTTTLWSARLSQNLETVTTLGHQLMSNTEAWQSNIIEGPDMYDNQVTTGSGSNATTTTTTTSSTQAATRAPAPTASAGPRARVRLGRARTNPLPDPSSRPNRACPGRVDQTSTRCRPLKP